VNERRIVFRQLAIAEINEAAAWYEDQREGLGLEFINAVSSSIERSRIIHCNINGCSRTDIERWLHDFAST
jgi:hypothetical protein